MGCKARRGKGSTIEQESLRKLFYLVLIFVLFYISLKRYSA